MSVLSKDLKIFSAVAHVPRDIAPIDVGILHIGNRYYALIKDERYRTPEWVTGKTIRIASSASLKGPYSVRRPHQSELSRGAVADSFARRHRLVSV